MSRKKKKNNSELDNLIKEYQGNPQSIPLYVLAEISKEKGDLYRKIISSEFSGSENVFGRKRLSFKSPVENETQINSFENSLVDFENEYFRIQKEKKTLEDLYNEKHLSWAEKYVKYLEAKKEFDELKKELINIKSSIEKYETSLKVILKDIQKVSKDSAELESFVLVHRTATIKQLRVHQKRQMVVTRIDAPYQYAIGVADEVFDKDVNYIDLPYYMTNRELTFEEKSAIAFANMVYYYETNHIEYEAIYSAILISQLLRFNGFYS